MKNNDISIFSYLIENKESYKKNCEALLINSYMSNLSNSFLTNNDIIDILEKYKSLFFHKNNMNGLPLLGFSIKNSENLFDLETFNSLSMTIETLINNQLKKEFTKKVSMKNEEFLTGNIGLGNYLLENCNSNLTIENLIILVKRCIELTDIKYEIPCWKTTIEESTTLDKWIYPKGHIRNGMAHGSAGILSFLSKFSLYGIKIPKLEEKIKTLTAFYWNSLDKRSNWAAKIDITNLKNQKINNQHKFQLSWCYGTSGICSSLVTAGKALRDNKMVDDSIQILTKKVCNNTNDLFISPSLCHGYGGLLIILDYFSQISQKEDLESAKQIVWNKFISYKKNKNDQLYNNYFINIENKIELNREIEGILTSQTSCLLSELSHLSTLSDENDPLKKILMIC